MADPICRWRNAKPETVCEIVEELPKNEMLEDEFRDLMAKSKFGKEFFHTPYQLACQLALYFIDDDKIYHPRFKNNISIEEADKYLHHWFSLYYVPNPYTKKGFTDIERPVFFEQTLAENLKLNNESSNFQDLLKQTFKDEIGEIDILRNLINKYSTFLKVENSIISLTEKGKAKMEINIDRDDKKSFFKSFDEKNDSSDNSYIKNSSQIIYYGVPGCGKSNRIDEETKNIPDDQKMRVVFHPEYTNADFVGQILPVQTAEGIEYRFKAGPFARILKRALKNPSKPYYLIIEEINRGNAAAIFGDLFQLLDRKNDGWSSYFVENLDLNSFIRSKNDKYSDKDADSSVRIGEIDFTENTQIRLPPNLSLYATMNTSDQNVFVLDNAFQRRWDMELVKNEFEESDISEEQKNIDLQRTALIKGSKITWEDFQRIVNAKISELSKENNFSSMIDKRLGCWFVKAEKNEKGEFVIKEEAFKNKILKYLWDDAFKFNREEVFESSDNFEALLEKVKMDNPNFGIFKNIDFSLNNEKSAESEN